MRPPATNADATLSPKASAGDAGKGSAAPSAASRSGLPTGTRDDPHFPRTPKEYDAIKIGQAFRDPGDGSLKEKD